MEEEGITVPSFRGLPTLFRVHEPCRPDRIRRSLLQFQFPRGNPRVAPREIEMAGYLSI